MEKAKKSRKPSIIKEAWEYGDTFTKLSFFILGMGNIARKQIVKGLIYLAMELGFLFYMFVYGFGALGHFDDLGTQDSGLSFNEATGVYEQTSASNSMLLLLAAVVAIMVIGFFVIMWRKNVLSAYRTQQLQEQGKHVKTFKEDVFDYFDT